MWEGRGLGVQFFVYLGQEGMISGDGREKREKGTKEKRGGKGGGDVGVVGWVGI